MMLVLHAAYFSAAPGNISAGSAGFPKFIGHLGPCTYTEAGHDVGLCRASNWCTVHRKLDISLRVIDLLDTF